MFQELGTLENLKESAIKLRTYIGEVVKPCGIKVADVVAEGDRDSVAIIYSER